LTDEELYEMYRNYKMNQSDGEGNNTKEFGENYAKDRDETGGSQPDCEQTHKGELGAGHQVRGDGSCNGCYTRGPDDCKKRCDANPDCAAWNLQTRTNRCWFKKKGFTTGDGHGFDEWVWGHSCNNEDGKHHTLQVHQVFIQRKTVARGNSEFGQNLYDVVRKSTEGNIVMSPYSASSVMAMAKTGARGKTWVQIRDGMRFPGEPLMLAGYKTIFKELRGNDKFTLETANKMYVMEGYKLAETFTEKMREFFNTEATLTNFAESEEARKMINDWVEEKTREKIKDLIPEGALDASTRLVLVNAIYFKGNWASQFKEKLTREADFYVSETKTAKAMMMNQELKVNFGLIEELDAEVVELPYIGDRLSMYIVLPRQKYGLFDLENKMPKKNIHEMFKEMFKGGRKVKVNIFLPKFKLEQSLELTDHFKKLGMTAMFDRRNADFSGMAGDPGDLFVSDVIQKAFIEVNEEGSEAAAATAVVFHYKSGRRFAKQFRCDHPFMFFIRDKKTKMVLFSGRVVDPSG